MKPVIIGVAGGSGSGKTTVVREIIRSLGSDQVAVIHHDSYYRDTAHLPLQERQGINYDHPDALETELLIAHLRELVNGRSVQVPVYDFTTHARAADVQRTDPRNVIIVDGLLILFHRELRELMDIKVFVDTDADLRFMRRLLRDIRERGRSIESVIDQYMATVRPMHLEFVEPSKRYADIIVPEGGQNRVGVELLISSVRALASRG
jgi:uridine kinase